MHPPAPPLRAPQQQLSQNRPVRKSGTCIPSLSKNKHHFPQRPSGQYCICFLSNTSLCFFCSRRAATSQVSRPNSSRAAGAGGSSNTMLKLYTDDSPGLRVYVSSSFRPVSSHHQRSSTVTPSLSSSFHSPSSHLYSSSISPPKLSAPSPSKVLKALPGRRAMQYVCLL